MDRFCRGCLVRYEEPTELLQYTEKNRRLFVYCTGLQVKRTDTFAFQLCRGCYVNMKVACNFKKQCRNSDKLFRSYQGLKNAEDNLDLSTFLKNNDDSWTFRFPGSSTPAYQRIRDDDNESTTTSIRNFMNDIMPDDDLPDTEARIIREVIDEEADVLDDSLDSHWLQDDASIDSDFKLDFGFSPFSTPRPVNNDRYAPVIETEVKIENIVVKSEQVVSKTILNNIHIPNTLKIPKDLENLDMPLLDDGSNHGVSSRQITDNELNTVLPHTQNVDLQDGMFQIAVKVERNLDETMDSLDVVNEFLKESENADQRETEAAAQCTIDRNLDEALRNAEDKEFPLDELLVSPRVIPEIKSPATPFINNLLFSDKLDLDETSNSSQKYKSGQCIETYENVTGEVEMTEEFTTDIKLEELDIEELRTEIIDEIDKHANQENENDFNITNFYCNMCKRTFKSLKWLQRHSKLKHSGQNRHERIWICDYCAREFKNRTNFVRHLEVHKRTPLPKLECDLCKMEFQSRNALKQHRRTHMGEPLVPKSVVKRFVCPECGASTDNRGNHAIHMKRHKKAFVYICPECNKGFYRQAELTVHMRYHTGEKPFPCTMCEKSFIRRDTLTQHIKIHLDLRPFKCVYCNSTFVNSTNLKNHHKKSSRCLKTREFIAKKQKEIEESSGTKTIVTEELVVFGKKENNKKDCELSSKTVVTEEMLVLGQSENTEHFEPGSKTVVTEEMVTLERKE